MLLDRSFHFPAITLFLLLACAFTAPISAIAAEAGEPSPSPKLERQLLKAEINKLEGEVQKIEDEEGTVADIIKLAPFVTALVALGGLIATFLKQIGESSHQRQLDREERERALNQRSDEQFQQITENLSSRDGAVRAAAAASIQMFMQPEYKEMHRRLFLLLLGSLRFPRRDFGDKLLVRTFQQIARAQIAEMRDGTAPAELDFSNCYLEHVKLDDVDLSEIDMAFANLHGAELGRSNFWRARGFRVELSDAFLGSARLEEARLVEANLVKADLRNARLVSTKLQGADATGADFRGAEMQEAQLDRSTLLGVRFEGANLDNAYFRGARLDEASLQSITRAIAWRKANWDEDTRAELERISSERS